MIFSVVNETKIAYNMFIVSTQFIETSLDEEIIARNFRKGANFVGSIFLTSPFLYNSEKIVCIKTSKLTCAESESNKNGEDVANLVKNETMLNDNSVCCVLRSSLNLIVQNKLAIC